LAHSGVKPYDGWGPGGGEEGKRRRNAAKGIKVKNPSLIPGIGGSEGHFGNEKFLGGGRREKQTLKSGKMHQKTGRKT